MKSSDFLTTLFYGQIFYPGGLIYYRGSYLNINFASLGVGLGFSNNWLMHNDRKKTDIKSQSAPSANYSSSNLNLAKSIPKFKPFSTSNSSISTKDFLPKFLNLSNSCVS